jgi:hypothetical protein
MSDSQQDAKNGIIKAIKSLIFHTKISDSENDQELDTLSVTKPEKIAMKSIFRSFNENGPSKIFHKLL